jgi:HPt (histidine-containing phosphotransfer) domain-containing protein
MDVDMQILDPLFLSLTGHEQWRSVTNLFDSGWAHRLSVIENSTLDQRFAEAKAAAHALKGSCAMFGAKSCALKCEQLEALLGAGDIVGVRDVLTQIKVDLRDFRTYLDHELRSRCLLS